MGPMVTKTFIDFSAAEAGVPGVAEGEQGCGRRAPRGAPVVVGGPKRHAHGLLLRWRVLPVRSDLGRRVRAHEDLPARAAAAVGLRVARPALALPVHRADPIAPSGAPTRSRARSPTERPNGPEPTGSPTPEPPAQSLTIVAPSPPSPRSPARKLLTSGCVAAWARTASRNAPVPRPWMISDLLQARPARRRRGSARAHRAPRPPGPRAGRARTPPSAPASA